MNGSHYLKRLAAVMGLLLMLPLGYQLVMGSLSPTDAAIRAGALFVGVVAVRKMANLAPTGRAVLVPAPQDDTVEVSAEG